MHQLLETLNAWSEPWAEMMVAISWQATVLVVGIALVSLALRRVSPGVRFWLWQIVAIKLLVMPFWAMQVPPPAFMRPATLASASDPMSARATSSTKEVGSYRTDALPMSNGREPSSTARLPALPVHGSEMSPNASPSPQRPRGYQQLRSLSFPSWLLLAWVSILVVQILRLARQQHRLGRLLREATPAGESLNELVRAASSRLGLRRVPKTLLVPVDCSPFACGILAPALVLPRSLPQKLQEPQLLQVLLHELAHVKRHDLLWNWPPEIARICFFFHPLMYYVSYRVRLERELSCDRLAMLASGVSAAEYATTLVEAITHAAQPAALKSAAMSSLGLEGDGAPRGPTAK